MVFICRHGQTEWNIEKRQQGWKDSPLTEKGVMQGKMLGNELKRIGDINNIYSSPLLRAYNTSKSIQTILENQSEIYIFDELKECSFGIFEGKTSEDKKNEPYKSMLEERIKDMDTKYNWVYPEGESYFDVEKRVKIFLNQIDLESNDVIVAHEAINRMLLKVLGDLSIEESMSISQPNDIIYKIDGFEIFNKKILDNDNDNSWKQGLLLK